MDCSQQVSSDHEILQARILEWVAIHFSRGSSWPSDWTQVSWFAGRFFTLWATTEALAFSWNKPKSFPVEGLHLAVLLCGFSSPQLFLALRYLHKCPFLQEVFHITQTRVATKLLLCHLILIYLFSIFLNYSQISTVDKLIFSLPHQNVYSRHAESLSFLFTSHQDIAWHITDIQ